MFKANNTIKYFLNKTLLVRWRFSCLQKLRLRFKEFDKKKVKGLEKEENINTMKKIINNHTINKFTPRDLAISNGASNFKYAFVFLSIFVALIFSNSQIAFAVDTTPPDVDMSYMKNPSGVGTNTITATYTEPISSTPTISIDQPGSTDISNVSMTPIPTGSFWKGQNVLVSNWKSITYGNGMFVAIATNSSNIMISPDGINWTPISGPSYTNWQSIAYGNGTFVAVAGSGKVMTSQDGVNWTLRTASSPSSQWESVTYGNGTFVVVSNDTMIMTSPDGENWTSRPVAVTGYDGWKAVTYGNGIFVAIPSVNGHVISSTDGINWNIGSGYSSYSWKSVVYGNGTFVAVAYNSNTVMTSANGTDWTMRTGASSANWSSVAYGNGTFVAVSSNNNAVMTSTDGISWTSRTGASPVQWQSIAYGNGTFVAVASDWGVYDIMISSYSYLYNYTVNQNNGSTYKDGTAIVSLSATTDLVGNVSNLPTNNAFIIDTTGPAVSLSYSKTTAGVGTETIFANYSEPISSTPTISIDQPGSIDISNASMNTPASLWSTQTVPISAGWTSITYGNGLFVAVSRSGIITSPDGINWILRQGDTYTNWSSVTYGNGIFVAISNSTHVATSPDGITWTSGNGGVSWTNWNSVTYGNGTFVAVSSSDQVMTSSDGISWTSRTGASSNNWSSVTYGNGTFVAVSPTTGNSVMTSSDGIIWTIRTVPSSYSWESVTYGNGIFVAIRSYGRMTSPDGITWTDRTDAPYDGWNYVTYGNGLFLAVASYSTSAMVSSDGIKWNSRTMSSSSGWNSVAYGNGKFVVATGYGNTFLTTPASYSYNYTVNVANGSTYVDGNAVVSLSSVTDPAGNTALAPTNTSFEINTAPPTVAMSYSKSPAGIGAMTITATYNKPVVSAPTISINQPGSTDISNDTMTLSGDRAYIYSYNVNLANGNTYIDGVATVSLSSVLDDGGNTASAPTNTSFNIETVPPTYAITYSVPHIVKSGDIQTITATFNELMADTPKPKIAISGANTLSSTDMTKVDTTHYTYAYTVGAGNGTATVALSTGTDVGTNPLVVTPTSGATFIIDNTIPTDTVTAICSSSGNGCTTSGINANPQEVYTFANISGTSQDEIGGSGIDKVEVSIKDTNTNKYYNGTSFISSNEAYILSAGTTTWSYNSIAVPLTIDHIYTINAKASDVAGNSYITSKQFKFVNAPPVVTNVTASQDFSGVVTVHYDVTDIESSQTTNSLFYKINSVLSGSISSSDSSFIVSDATNLKSSGTIMLDNEIIAYTTKTGNVLSGITRGYMSTTPTTHTNSNIYMYAVSASGIGIGLSNKGTGKNITWIAATDANGYESNTGVVRVVANDGSAGSMIGSMDSSPLHLDAKAPTATVTFDAGVAGVLNSGTVYIKMPIDISTVEYKISDDIVTQTNPTDTGWVSITADTTIPWTFDSDIEAKTIKYQYRDAYGNTSSEVSTSTQAPVPSGSFIVQDTSNIFANPPYYDMYVGWESTDATNFASYKLEYATSSDNVTYGDYIVITDSGFSVANNNYFVYRNLNPNLYYRFRLAVVGTNGNTSVRSNSFVTTKPDGVQNYGEGGGGSVASASKVENVVVSQDSGDKNVSVSYKLTDTSITKKVNPSYESYLFYNIGITLPENSFNNTNNTLTLTNASKLQSSGYILVNNEVIKYTSKTGNILSGLTRGTWPTLATTGRVTRTNPVFFAGSPVWILASGTTPTSITDTSISTGQNNTIAWNTYDEINLAGGTYPNVGIKVLVHDNQDAGSGPLSNQNDFSEDGVLSTLDLTAPSISFTTTSSTALESVTPVVINLNLSRAYPLPVTVDYTLTGTANSSDYTLSNGTVSFAAGETSKDISIPIIDDTLKETDETIILTLSNPTNATLGTDTVYTYTITDNDTTSGIEFESTSGTGLESVTPVSIPVVLAEVSGADTTVDYTITGTATEGSDYTLSNGTLIIPAGQTTADISIPIINDILKEDNETIIITLSNPTNATLGSKTVYTYTIEDDDTYPTIEFNDATSSEKEDANTVNIPVSISTTYAEDVTVDYKVTGGSAEGSGVDYTLADGTLTIPAGQTTTSIPLVIFDDTLSEDTETILITLSNPVNAILGANSIHANSILDNEIAVTSVTDSNIKATSIRINWTTADYTDSLIEYGTIAPGEPGAYNLSKVNTEKVLEHSVYIGGLTPSTKYYARTTSTNLAGEVTTKEFDFTTTAGPVISNVSVKDVTDTGATITWTTDIAATSYVNTSKDQTLKDSTRNGDVQLVTDHSVVLTGLSSNSIYYYSVDGTDIDSNSGEDANNGSYYTFSTGADVTPPVITNIATPIVTTSDVAITWLTNEEATGQINYGTVTAVYDKSTELIYVPLTSHLVTINSLTANTKYYYTITSTDANGNTTVSEEQTFTTPNKDVIYASGGGGSSGVAQSLYDLVLAENQKYKAKYGTDTTESTISNIVVSEITPFGATVGFETSKDTVAGIDYGKDSQYGSNSSDLNFGKSHLIKLNGLSLGTKYYFKVKAIDRTNSVATSDEQTFTTKFLTENMNELKQIDNVEQFQKEIEATIESILPSLVPPFIDKPVVSDITESSATISFKTNVKAYPMVSYIEDANYDATKANPYDGEMSDTSVKDVNHTLSLIGLKPNTKYHLMAKAFSLPQVVGKSDDITFMTATSKIRGSIIDVKTDSFTVVWTTDEPTTSIIEYKNLTTGRISQSVDNVKNSSHSVKLENLTPGTTYEVNISGINDKGNVVQGGGVINVKTSTDNIPPVITNIKVESALIVGRTDKVQTIVSWTTDEPSTSTVYFEEGSGSPTKDLANKQEDTEFTKNHVVILTALKPGTVYRFTVSSSDDAGNMAKPPIRTIITPKKTESIVDVIFKNFDATFNFVNNVR